MIFVFSTFTIIHTTVSKSPKKLYMYINFTFDPVFLYKANKLATVWKSTMVIPCNTSSRVCTLNFLTPFCVKVSCPSLRLAGRMVHVMNEPAAVGLCRSEKKF